MALKVTFTCTLIIISPIFTYGAEATTKHGVKADEHAMAYSYIAQLIPGEQGLRPIRVVTAVGVDPLPFDSHIFFRTHIWIQYHIKVKDLGQVHPDWLSALLDNWRSMNRSGTLQPANVTAAAAKEV